MLFALVVSLLPALSGNAVGASTDPGWSVESTSPTTNLSDGQRLLINVRSTDPTVSVNAIQIRECRPGVTYSVPDDMNPDNGNCPPRAVSSSADYFVVRGASDGLTALAKTNAGASVPFIVGAGVVEWTTTSAHSLTCDPTHACALVMQISLGTASGPNTVFRVLNLTFTDDNPLAACGGFAKGVVTTGGSDEISDAWATWTRDVCRRTGARAPTGVAFPGEGPSVTAFAAGLLDLVYTSAGYDADVGLAPPIARAARPAVAVPIALNASVIAAGGGQHQLVDGLAGDKARYPDGSLELNAAEIGALLGGGQPWFSRLDKPYQKDVLDRNPALKGILYDANNGVYAPSESLASSWFLTKYLATLAPTDFVQPTVVPAKPHGATASLALANPPFDQINLYTGRPALAKVTVPAEFTATDGPIWTMTDLASARALDLTPVALPSGGTFVAPTPESMNAAVAAMHPDADGLLLPNSSLATTTVAAGGVQPYPLTYVLYAFVPAQPLYDANTCALRTTSQELLTSWLDYVTGVGQQNLPAGMEPLPAALRDQAKTAVAKVGASKITGRCAATKHTNGGGKGTGNGKGTGKGNGTGTGMNQPVGGGITNPVVPPFVANTGRFASGRTSAAIVVPVTKPPRQTSTPSATRDATTASVHIPPFAGRDLAGSLGGILALVGIALLMTIAAWATAKVIRVRGATSVLGELSDFRRIGGLALLWVGVGIVGIALVAFELGPILQQRDQRNLLARYEVAVSNAANEFQGLPGQTETATAPEFGSPVGIIEIGALKSQNVVVEGVGAAQTRKGPGHVPGTAGLGQHGNSVVLARRSGYGGAFSRIGDLHEGDHIVVTTTQGQSVYDVTTVRHVNIAGGSNVPDAPSGGASTDVRLASASVRSTDSTIDALYAPTSDDRLTLVTAASRTPWETSSAIEVVARLQGKPFAPTPQQARIASATGTHGDSGTLPATALALLALAAVVAGAVALYDKLRFRTAYVLTIAPLVAVTVIVGETLMRLLPAWT